MSQQTVAKISPVIKRLMGADLDATRAFLRRQCFVEGTGFSSQRSRSPVSAHHGE